MEYVSVLSRNSQICVDAQMDVLTVWYGQTIRQSVEASKTDVAG
jgi:hypothetical protein